MIGACTRALLIYTHTHTCTHTRTCKTDEGCSLLFCQHFFPFHKHHWEPKATWKASQPTSPALLCLTHLIPCVFNRFQAWWAVPSGAPDPSDAIPWVTLRPRQAHPRDGETAWGPRILWLRESQELLTARARPSFCKVLPGTLHCGAGWFSSLINMFSTLGPEVWLVKGGLKHGDWQLQTSFSLDVVSVDPRQSLSLLEDIFKDWNCVQESSSKGICFKYSSQIKKKQNSKSQIPAGCLKIQLNSSQREPEIPQIQNSVFPDYAPL